MSIANVNSWVAFTGLLCGALLVSGCGNKLVVNSASKLAALRQADYVNHDLIFSNEALAKRLGFSDVKLKQKQGRLAVTFQLSSQYHKTQTLQYQVQWFDQQDKAIATNKANWQVLTLASGTAVLLQATVPSIDASYFKVYVIEIPEKLYKQQSLH
ncbi:DUF1425 domain-containing protein [Colwellia chukchiensis]|uniref:DUF1425 domain-containing protein n=1 Tax=Colwellia chukchiensis TaxID=641665 RepID=UPI001C31C308|nr:YcfL family protein [Colwellia chukchiensis]